MISKFRKILYEQLTQGASPKSLALACSMAFVIATFPIIGTTTIICLIVGTKLKLNQPIMQVVNYILAPVQLLLMPVFFKAGQFIYGDPRFQFNFQNLQAEFLADWSLFLSKYGFLIVQTILGWLVISPVIGFLIYVVLQPLLSRSRFSLSRIDSNKL